MRDIGALPSRCSGAAQTIPKLAKAVQTELYVLKFPPRPCEKTTRGYFEDDVLGSSGESGVAGMLVYLMRDGSAEMNDARRVPAPRKDEYASIH